MPCLFDRHWRLSQGPGSLACDGFEGEREGRVCEAICEYMRLARGTREGGICGLHVSFLSKRTGEEESTAESSAERSKGW